MKDQTHEGGCLCGVIRYRAQGQPFNVTHCHCGICRRASGAAFVSWASFRAADFAFLDGTPAYFRSSDRAVRGFCMSCGTPLTFRFDRSPEVIDVTLGSLDQPECVSPQDHIWASRRLPWIRLCDGLPEYPQSRILG
ncbi:MAG: GFA family protein [Betaproteobacteria bacterium]|nr:GFA family protein [Betaproteobacteria bacterium]